MKTIKMDFDGSIDWKRVRIVAKMFSLKFAGTSKVAKTRKGWHIYLDVMQPEELSDEDICFLQCAMGSDYKREMFNWKRIRFGTMWQKQTWNVLFAQKWHRKGDIRRIASYEVTLPYTFVHRHLREFMI